MLIVGMFLILSFIVLISKKWDWLVLVWLMSISEVNSIVKVMLISLFNMVFLVLISILVVDLLFPLLLHLYKTLIIIVVGLWVKLRVVMWDLCLKTILNFLSITMLLNMKLLKMEIMIIKLLMLIILSVIQILH